MNTVGRTRRADRPSRHEPGRAMLAGLLLLLPLLLSVAVAAVLALRAAQTASHERDWIEPQAVLPAVERAGDRVTVSGVRNFRWRSELDYDPCWETRSYDLGQIRRLWFGVSPFAGRWRGPAHTFLSFELADCRFVAVSVEARRERGERYGVVAGLLNRFEVVYVIGDERDVIGLRTHVWRHPVHLYPIAASPDTVRAVFLAMLARAEQIRARPEFYNTVVHNCASALLHAANQARDVPIPFGLDVILPGYADRRLQRLGLLDTELGLAAARAAFLVTGRATAGPLTDLDFSRRIREPAAQLAYPSRPEQRRPARARTALPRPDAAE